MTDYQLLRSVTSLAYRRRLLDDVEELEATVRKYLSEHEITRIRIAGYDIQADNGQIRVEEVPIVPANQLHLPLYAAHYDEKDKSETRNPTGGR
ncbi:MAG: hypothetical protein KAU50_07930 [Candidatus Marinimicrobia bacterium]|nr:hypothetical protein [Candidatus Neomarinimicrobiota bacterium]